MTNAVFVIVRTKHEGGDWDPLRDHYRDLITDSCASGMIDLVDIQYLNPAAKRCLAAARTHRVPVLEQPSAAEPRAHRVGAACGARSQEHPCRRCPEYGRVLLRNIRRRTPKVDIPAGITNAAAVG